MNNELKAIDETEDYLVVKNYIVLHGGSDLAGEYFHAGTDLESGVTKSGQFPIDWEHATHKGAAKSEGEPGPGDYIGWVDWSTKATDDMGTVVNRILNRRHAFVRAIEPLIKAGLVGTSSQASGHGIVKSADGRIDKWPLVMDTLTVTPMEPRMLGGNAISAIKALSQDFPEFVNQQPNLKAFIQEAEKDTAMDEATVHADSQTLIGTQEASMVKNMNEHEETKATETPVVSVDAIVDGVKGALTDEIKALTDRLEALEDQPLPDNTGSAPAQIKGGVGVSRAEDQAKAADEAWYNGVIRNQASVKASMQVGTDSEGGYLVPQTYANEIVKPLHEMSVLRAAGARVITLPGTKSFELPVLTNSSAAVLTAEEAAYTQQEPTLAAVTLNPYKYGRISKASDELVSDSRFNVLSEVLAPDAVFAFSAAENSAFTVGTGSSQPQGVVTGSSLGVTAASATAITADEIIDTYHSLSYFYRQNATWMMNDSTAQLIRKLKDSDNQYLWQPGLQAGQPDRLLGRPVITNNSMPAATTGLKSIIFGDLRYFVIADFGPMSVKRLDELYAANGQIGFRWNKRFDSVVTLSAAIKHLIQA